MKRFITITAFIILTSCEQHQNKMLENATIVERVSFKVNKGFSNEDGQQAMLKLNEFVATQPGYVARVTSIDTNNVFLDIVYWKTLENAKAAAENIMNEESIQEVFDIIDKESMVFGHFEVFNIH